MANLFPNAVSKIIFQQIRYIPRWSHRIPARVLPSHYEHDEIHEREETNSHEEKITWKQPKLDEQKHDNNLQVKPKKNLVPLSITSKKKVPVVTDMLETIIDDEGNFIYTKMKNSDVRVGSILTQMKTKKDKANPEKVLLEGKRLIKDALLAGCKLDYILFSRINEVQYLKPYLPKLGAKLYKMPYKEMQMWSELTTNPGIMAIIRTPKVETFTNANSMPITVICDNIRDPSNLGAILRACSGVGCQRVLLTKGCVNLWDGKVLRSSSGAHFKLQIHQRQEWTKIQEMIGDNVNMFVADNKLNSSQEAGLNNSIPVLPYYGVDYNSSKHTVIVVGITGGETEGVSMDCYKTVAQYNGVRVNIPLSNNVESLNSAMAVGIIVFEIKRQLTCI